MTQEQHCANFTLIKIYFFILYKGNNLLLLDRQVAIKNTLKTISFDTRCLNLTHLPDFELLLLYIVIQLI